MIQVKLRLGDNAGAFPPGYASVTLAEVQCEAGV
jgi:hypothetical protein